MNQPEEMHGIPERVVASTNGNFISRPFQCAQCQQTFGRVEHLTRHSRSHMKERNLKCSLCRKGFYRVDALKRHEQTHQESKRVILGVRARACLSCAAARRKCSGDVPCAACERRVIVCKYPEVRGNENRPSDITHGSNHDANHAVSDNISSSPNASLMSWSTSASPPTGDLERDQRYLQRPGDVQQQISDTVEGPPNQFIPTLPMSSRGDNSHQTLGYRNFDNHRTIYSCADTRINAIGNNDMASQSGGVFSTPWLDSNFSSINWIPEDWVPDYQFENTYPIDETIPGGEGNIVRVPARRRNSPNSVAANATQQPRMDRLSLSRATLESHEISSPESQITSSPGHYYVDGDGSRLPRIRRAPYRTDIHTSSLAEQFSPELRNKFLFPDIEPLGDGLDTTSSNRWRIPEGTYSEICSAFRMTCLTSTRHPTFESDRFPSLELLSLCFQLQFENFQPIMPFLHLATFDLSATNWLLILALAAIGSHYMTQNPNEQLSVCLHELTRRSIHMVSEAESDFRPSNLVLIQAKLLNSIGMMYCGDERLQKWVKDYRSDLASFCDFEWRNNDEAVMTETGEDMRSPGDDWRFWIDAETRRRTGYSVWLLDCMWVFHFQTRPQLFLENATVSIPCQEVLWEAESAFEWQQLYHTSTENPSLYSAIQLAYVEKRIQSSTGEFARILCIHALFRRTWEVESYLSEPLSLWTPTAEKQDISIIENSGPAWLPSNPTYSKWRNSACDVLDILHWHANSVIGATSGMEHPTVLHLHLARVILLTPHRKILRLARLMTGEATPTNPTEIEDIRNHVKRWALEDQYKARLAMIHAGVLFWHVRRYSTDAFYEPVSITLATLALWAYGSFAPHTSKQSRDGEPASDDEYAESLFPTSMQLDRPADDELVQLFVKRGDKMRANITGVGNLCSLRGPVRVLEQGINLLAGLKSWGYCRQAYRTLRGLSENCRQETV